jgi:hypothetical protein
MRKERVVDDNGKQCYVWTGKRNILEKGALLWSTKYLQYHVRQLINAPRGRGTSGTLSINLNLIRIEFALFLNLNFKISFEIASIKYFFKRVANIICDLLNCTIFLNKF